METSLKKESVEPPSKPLVLHTRTPMPANLRPRRTKPTTKKLLITCFEDPPQVTRDRTPSHGLSVPFDSAPPPVIASSSAQPLVLEYDSFLEEADSSNRPLSSLASSVASSSSQLKDAVCLSGPDSRGSRPEPSQDAIAVAGAKPLTSLHSYASSLELVRGSDLQIVNILSLESGCCAPEAGAYRQGRTRVGHCDLLVRDGGPGGHTGTTRPDQSRRPGVGRPLLPPQHCGSQTLPTVDMDAGPDWEVILGASQDWVSAARWTAAHTN